MTDPRDAEIARLRDFARKATKVLVGLTPGGSEYFAGQVGGIYLADLERCGSYIRNRRERDMRMVGREREMRVKAEAERDAANAEVRERRDLHASASARLILAERARDAAAPVSGVTVQDVPWTPEVAELIAAVNFLSDRLHEHEMSDDAGDMCRDFMGHIEPAHARVCAALSALEGK